MKNLKEFIKESLLADFDEIEAAQNKGIIEDSIIKYIDDYYTYTGKLIISDEPNRDGKYEVDCSGNIRVKDNIKDNIQLLTSGMFIFVDVKGTFDVSYCVNLKSLEGAPEKVGGDFDCQDCNNLKSLEGAPEKVGGDFDCQDCISLTSLEGAPKKVGGDFDCHFCASLVSLKGAPKKVGGKFFCDYCKSLTSLKGAPKIVGGFYCHNCGSLTSLKGAPEEVLDKFFCHRCRSLTSLEGSPKKVGGDFDCMNCGKKFTEDDVKTICKVKGNISV